MSNLQVRAKSIFLNALEIEELERVSYVENQCGNNELLNREVVALLDHAQRLGRFLATNAEKGFTPLDQANFDSHGKCIGPYKLLQQIGEGGMGTVFLAEQTDPVRRTVALKVIKPGLDSKHVVARFEAERQALAMMNHPNIAKVLDAGATEQGRPYFVMELVEGTPITEFCDKHKLDTRERLKLFVSVCQAIQHAHQKGLIHRDLKPSNILVEMNNLIELQEGTPVPKVIDFGVAKATGQQLSERSFDTQVGQLLGTPMYMSPEQADPNGMDVDTRSDIYSLGVLLYEILTGQTPFEKETLRQCSFWEMQRLIREVDPPRPSARVSTLKLEALSTVSDCRQVDMRKLSQQLRGELDWIVMKALAKDRELRYESAYALAADLERFLSGDAVMACPPTMRYRWNKLTRRYKTIIATGLTVVCAILIGSTVSIFQAVRATQAEHIAETRLESERVARVAEQQARTDAERSQKMAEQNASNAYRQQYRAEMQLGLVDLETGNSTRLYKTLISHLPDSIHEDRRGWEWFYLLSRYQEGRTLCEHYSTVSSLDWSPDGRYLASTSSDGDAIVWDSRSGKLLRRFSFGGTMKRGVAWSPDSQRLAWGSAGDENAVRVWDRHTDDVRVLRGHSHSVTSCMWSPDGSRLATTSMDKTANIWDAETWTSLHVLRGHPNNVNRAWWSNDSRLLITVGRGIKVWNAKTGDLTRELHSNTYTSVSMSSTLPQQLVVGTWGGKCRLIDMDTWQTVQEISAHAGQVNAVAFSPDGAAYASAGADGRVIVWKVADGRQLSVLRGHQGGVSSLAWNPNGNQLATGGIDGNIKVWDVPVPHYPIVLQAIPEAIQSLTWSKDNGLLTSLGESTRIIWDRETGKTVDSSSADAKTREALSPDGRLRALAMGSKGAFKILIENTERSEVVCELKFSSNFLPTMIWSPNSQRLVAGDSTRFDAWEIPGGQRLFAWSGPAITAGSWAADCNRFAMVGGGDSSDNGSQAWDGHLHVFDIERKMRLMKVRIKSKASLATSVAWHPNGDSLATGSENGLVGVWNAATGRQLAIAQMHIAAVNGLDWAPDGRRIASVSEDSSMKVWDPCNGDELLSLTEGKRPLTAVKWSSDGVRLASGNNAGRIQIWDAANGSAVMNSAEQHRSLAQMHAMRASQNSDNGDLPRALVDFSRAIELTPSRSSYRRSRAIVHAMQGQMNEALTDVTSALDLDPEDTHALRTRVDLYAGLGRWTKALADVSRLVELKLDPFTRYQQAVILLMLGQVESYREICHKGFVGNPDQLIYEAQLQAWTCALTPDAVADFKPLLPLVRKSIGLDPDAMPGSLGVLLFRAGQAKEAVDVLIEANRFWEQSGSIVSPGSYSDSLPGYTWYFLAMACHDLGRFAESKTWYDKAESYTQTTHSQTAVFAQSGSINWHQRVVLEMLQREARKVLGVSTP